MRYREFAAAACWLLAAPVLAYCTIEHTLSVHTSPAP